MMKRVGEIALTRSGPDQLHATVDVEHDGPCVYMWVEEPPLGAPVVLYVGKAGTTLARRCRQHAQGFKGSDRGKSHAHDLMPRIRAGSRIGIHALWPDPLPFAGDLIPTHSSVEDYLIDAIHPRPVRNRPHRERSSPICA